MQQPHNATATTGRRRRKPELPLSAVFRLQISSLNSAFSSNPISGELAGDILLLCYTTYRQRHRRCLSVGAAWLDAVSRPGSGALATVLPCWSMLAAARHMLSPW